MIDEYAHIKFLAETIANRLHPQEIYLFGYFADGRNTTDSDYGFYVILSDDDVRNPIDLIVDAQKSLRHKKIALLMYWLIVETHSINLKILL